MRIIFLNSWYGQVHNPFFDFITKHSDDTDIFCLIEVDKNLNIQLKRLLSDFVNVESHKNIDSKNNYDISIFFSDKLKIKSKSLNIIKDQKIGDCLSIEFDDFVLCGVHGLAQPGDKLDNSDRIQQSKNILEAVNGFNKPKIIGGDFNLMPETQSVKMFEREGYKNLIKDFGIKNTRNKFCWDQFPVEVKKFGKQYFADYCFVSPQVKVLNFEVPKAEVSDHEPLILDFEI